jgi:hypothetical protein
MLISGINKEMGSDFATVSPVAKQVQPISIKPNSLHSYFISVKDKDLFVSHLDVHKTCITLENI